MVRIKLLFIVFSMLLTQCSIKKTNNYSMKCNYKLNDVKDVYEKLYPEIDKYVKSYMTHTPSKDKYIVMWKNEKEGNTIYSFSYQIDIDEHTIETTYSIYHYKNQFLIFVMFPEKKNLRMEKCSITEIIRKIFPNKYKDYQEGIWSITNIEYLPVYELTFKDSIFIRKRIYYQ